MRRICLAVCTLLFVLLIIPGCGKADTDKTMITITSNGETTLPYLRWSWGDSRTDQGWVSGDALQLIYELQDIAPDLPVVSYNDDFAV